MVLGVMDFAMRHQQGIDPSCSMLIQVATTKSAIAKIVLMPLSAMERIG